MIGHGHETIPGAKQPWGRIGGHERRLDRESTRPTHGIQKGSARLRNVGPAGTDQNGSRQIFLERCLAPLQSIASAMKTVPGKIKAQGRLIPIQVEVDSKIGIGQIDRRPLATQIHEIVDHRVLDLLSPKKGVGDGRSTGCKIHRDHRVRIEVARPLDPPDPRIQLFDGRRRKTGERPENSVRQPTPKTGAVGGFHSPLKGHACAPRNDLRRTQLRQLIGQKQFKP